MRIAFARRPGAGDEVVVGRTGRRYAGKAFGLLRLGHPVRRRFIALVEWPWFDRVVLALILVNCVAMAASNPLAVEPPEWERPLEWVFTLAFTVEGLCKMVAMGLVWESRCAYVWDVWHVLDLVAVVTAWISLLPLGTGNFAIIRTVQYDIYLSIYLCLYLYNLYLYLYLSIYRSIHRRSIDRLIYLSVHLGIDMSSRSRSSSIERSLDR